MSQSENLPSPPEKPSLLDWLETYLPFKLPRIPLFRTAANFDKAAGALVTAGGDNFVARIEAVTNRIKAKSSAEVAYIEYGKANIAESGKLAERALHYALGDTINAQKNREEILRLASENLKNEPPNEDAQEAIDDDWLNFFKRHSETKSNAAIQQLWARILSSEIRKPGSTSLRTLDFLSTVSMTEAQRIVRLFTFVLDERYVPQWVHQTNKLSFAECFKLQEIGIVAGVYGIGGPATKMRGVAQHPDTMRFSVILSYYAQVGIIETPQADYELAFPTMVLTDIGKDLFAITETKRPDYDYFSEFLATLGTPPVTSIRTAQIISLETNTVRYNQERVVYPKS